MKIDVARIRIKTGVPIPTGTGKYSKLYALVNRLEVDQSVDIPMPDTTYKAKMQVRNRIRGNYEGDDKLVTRITDDGLRVWCVEREDDE